MHYTPYSRSQPSCRRPRNDAKEAVHTEDLATETSCDVGSIPFPVEDCSRRLTRGGVNYPAKLCFQAALMTAGKQWPRKHILTALHAKGIFHLDIEFTIMLQVNQTLMTRKLPLLPTNIYSE